MPCPEPEETLAEGVPVEMPALPTRLTVNTVQQFKALGDKTRSRILGMIQLQPATAKQIADRLGIAPGTIGHHLQVLEDAGLAQIVARRLVHGIVAKYYTRTARIFAYDFPSEVSGNASAAMEIHTKARDELAETLLGAENSNCRTTFPEACSKVAFPHARLSAERAEEYSRRIFAIVDELLQEEPNPDGQVYGFYSAFFIAPPYLQSSNEQAQTATAEQ
ncbi:MAG: hypothetical protein NVS4B12_28460 [Ktedonobacteraceae bacterium]